MDHDQAIDLAAYVRARDWLDRHPNNPIFRTYSSLEWFIKRHRRELIEDGALITRSGRAGSLVHDDRFPKTTVKILRRESLEDQKTIA